MGTLRLLLAIVVVFGHSSGDIMIGGANAVELFYLISGFLISYVLVEQRLYSTAWRFYLNRYLRLYPVYAAVALLALLWYAGIAPRLGDTDFPDTFRLATPKADLLLAFTNATMLLQDWIMFLGVQHGVLMPVLHFSLSDVMLLHGLLIPQGWTLGLELSFYLIAPFVLPRRRLMWTLLVLSVLLRMLLSRVGLDVDPWRYRFFPNELALFMAGALSHQLLLPRYRQWLDAAMQAKAANLAMAVLLVFTVFYQALDMPGTLKSLVLLAIYALLLPLAFLFQQGNRWDQRIGELSYPVYICHMLLIDALVVILKSAGIRPDPLTIACVATVLSLLSAAALNRWIALPMQALRQRFRVQTRSQP